MKTTYITFILLAFSFNLFSCQTVVSLEDYSLINQPNTYYKDVNNKLNQFEGTWIYDNGTDYIKLALIKKIKAGIGNWFEDTLIGGFQYRHNGSEKINTLNQLNISLADPRDYNIDGNFFQNNHSPFDQYTTDNFRLIASINENGCISELNIRSLILNGQQAIQIYKWKSMELNQACTPVIPGGFYYLIKQ